MSLIADGLLITTALTAAVYCHILARRLRRLADLDTGIGGKISGLDSALEETRAALSQTQARLEDVKSGSQAAGERLRREIARAERLGDDLDAMSTRVETRLRRLYESENALDDDGIEVVAEPGISTPVAASGEAGEGAARAGDLADINGIERRPATALKDAAAHGRAVKERLPKVGRMGL
jgi:hypothetical protein